jgi:hypothetical protein
MTHLPESRRPRFFAATIAMVACLGLTIAGVAPSTAASTIDESQWGSQGFVTTTESAVTLHWDNSTAAAASNTVPRDESQQLSHTDGKTYNDLSPALNAAYAASFGSGNGITNPDGTTGLELSISQTQNLVNQSIIVSLSGAPSDPTEHFSAMVFQCWGAADEANPDPSHCEEATSPGTTMDANDLPLIAPDDPAAGKGAMPLIGKDGTSTQGSITTANTNEQRIPLSSGRIDTPFQVFTGAESSFLGCGKRDDAPSTDSCWLVAVPFSAEMIGATKALSNPGFDGPLTPSLWAQRMQVRLSMAPVQNGCPNGQSRTLGQGSEMLAAAMTSWAPALCAADNIALGYTKLGDEQSREQYTAGASNLIFTSAPVTGSTSTVYAPVAVAGVTFGFVVDHWQGLQTQQLKLTPQLIAKMLTESYQAGIDNIQGTQIPTKASWVAGQPESVFTDPQFRKVNGFTDADVYFSGGDTTGDFIVSNMRSDAMVQIWNWLLADHDAKSFLDGCPDANGMVINPFFSTRSYAECRTSASTLDAAAKAKIAETQSPDNYTPEAMSYPPDGTLIPQPSWYGRDPVPDGASNGTAMTTPLTLVDLHTRTPSRTPRRRWPAPRTRRTPCGARPQPTRAASMATPPDSGSRPASRVASVHEACSASQTARRPPAIRCPRLSCATTRARIASQRTRSHFRRLPRSSPPARLPACSPQRTTRTTPVAPIRSPCPCTRP